MEESWNAGFTIKPRKDCGPPESAKAFRHRVGSGTSAEMTSPASGLNPTARGTPLEKFMKGRTRTNKASLQGMATGRALLQGFAVSLITSGFVLSANANERNNETIGGFSSFLIPPSEI
jgi:hypothetical protein